MLQGLICFKLTADSRRWTDDVLTSAKQEPALNKNFSSRLQENVCCKPSSLVVYSLNKAVLNVHVLSIKKEENNKSHYKINENMLSLVIFSTSKPQGKEGCPNPHLAL